MGELHAWEIDAGPAGIYWELGTVAGTPPGGGRAVANRAEAEAAGAVVFHTLAEYEAEQELEELELVTAAERAEAAEVLAAAELARADRAAWARTAGEHRGFAELEARVARLERLAEDDRRGRDR